MEHNLCDMLQLIMIHFDLDILQSLLQNLKREMSDFKAVEAFFLHVKQNIHIWKSVKVRRNMHRDEVSDVFSLKNCFYLFDLICLDIYNTGT